jgi:putative glycosyltransferase (TIGR04372 family)
MKTKAFLLKLLKVPEKNDSKNTSTTENKPRLSNYEEALIQLHAGKWRAFNKLIAHPENAQVKVSRKSFSNIIILDNTTYAIGHFIFLAAFSVIYKKIFKNFQVLILCDEVANYELFQSFYNLLKTKNIHFIFCHKLCGVLRKSSFEKANIYFMRYHKRKLNYLQFLSLAEILRKGRAPLNKKSLEKSYVTVACKNILKETEGDKFVTIHLRNENDSVRNVDPLTYLPAILALKENRFKIYFVGSLPESMYQSLRKMDIHVNRSTNQWDAYLLTHCSHFIGVNSGPWVISFLYGIPTLITNCIPLVSKLPASSAFFLPKKVVDSTGKPISELTYGRLFGMSERKSLFEQHGYRVIDNTPQELKESILKFVFLKQNTPKNDWGRLKAQLLNQPYSSGYGLNLARKINNVF